MWNDFHGNNRSQQALHRQGPHRQGKVAKGNTETGIV